MIDKLLDFKNLKGRERKLIIGLAIAVGFSIYVQAVHKPLSRNITRYKFQIEKSRSRLDDLRMKFPDIDEQKENMQSLGAECEILLADIEKMERKLPARRNASQLLGEFTRLAKDVKLISIRQKMEQGDEYSKIFIELKLNAPYEQTVKYIRDIESISPFLVVDELDIAESKGKKAEGGTPVRLVVSSLLGEIPFAEQLKAREIKDAIAVSRDIFVSKARPASTIRKAELKLQGITFNAKSSTAIINSDVVKIGSKVGNLSVKQILSDTVILTDGVEDHILAVER